MTAVLSELARTLAERKQGDVRTSYVASLYAQGTAAILEKVDEEAGELVAAGEKADPKEIIHETADLWFHTLVLLSHLGLSHEAVLAELHRRQGQSGLEEKARREGQKRKPVAANDTIIKHKAPREALHQSIQDLPEAAD